MVKFKKWGQLRKLICILINLLKVLIKSQYFGEMVIECQEHSIWNLKQTTAVTVTTVP